MKKMIWIFALVGVLLLAGCGNKNITETQPSETQPKETEAIPTQTLPLDDLEIHQPTETEPVYTASVFEEKRVLEVVDYGSFNGMFVEDGTDESVENVACLLVENTTDQYMDYGSVTATIGGKVCNFVATGLPGGASAWILEKDRQTMEEGASFYYEDQTVSELKDVIQETDEVKVELKDGSIEVMNLSENTYGSVRVYYKQIHTDGNYLGGITYTTKTENLAPGASVELTAGHSTAEHCAVVRIDCTE